MINNDKNTIDNYSSINVKPDLKKIKSMRFEKSTRCLNEVLPTMIFFQGIIHFLVNVKKFFICICCCTRNGSKGDTIELEHHDRLKSIDLNNFFGDSDIETGAVIDPTELENIPELTDKMFRNACNDASFSALGYAKCFVILNKINKFIDLFVPIVIGLAIFLNFSVHDSHVFIGVLTPIYVIKVMFDWSVLMEKYANLADEFSKLANRKDENRLDEYESLVNRYRSCWLYSDSIEIKFF